MKFYPTLIAVLFFLSAAGQKHADMVNIKSLAPIKYNYKNCRVTIKPGQWQSLNSIQRLPLTITISNNAADTLKYGMWSTNWLNYYVDNKELRIQGSGSDILHNFFEALVLPPHKSATLDDYIVDTIPNHIFHGKFSLFFRLVLCRDNEIMENVILNKDGSFSNLPAGDVKNRQYWLQSNIVEM